MLPVSRSMPAGDTAIMPSPFGTTCTVAAGRKTTPTVRSTAPIVIRHWFGTSGWIVQPAESAHVSKRKSVAGVAVSVITVPEGKKAAHVVGQLMPAGELVTVPLPAWIVTVSFGSTFARA
jgi:hypothetical protein